MHSLQTYLVTYFIYETKKSVDLGFFIYLHEWSKLISVETVFSNLHNTHSLNKMF